MITRIKEIAMLEKKKYVLKEFACFIPQYQEDITKQIKKAKPSVPQGPGGMIQPIPNYNAKAYIKKAKASGTGLGAFRENCVVLGFALMSSVIGLLVCWIPFLLAIFSWPFSIFYTRSQAYKIYLKECREIESRNNIIKKNLTQYNRESAEYPQKLKDYERKQALYEQMTAFLTNLQEEVKTAQEDLNLKLNQHYAALNSPSINPGYMSIHALLYYIDSGKASTAEEALQLLHKEVTAGKIPQNIYLCQRYRDASEETVTALLQTIDACNKKATMMGQELQQHLLKKPFDTDYMKFYHNVLTNEL